MHTGGTPGGAGDSGRHAGSDDDGTIPLAPAGDAGVRAEGEDPAVAFNVCGECGAPRRPGAVVCLRCGFNERTGRAAITEVGGVRHVTQPCPGCGYDLTGVRGGRCPECGQRPHDVREARRQAEREGRDRGAYRQAAGLAGITLAASCALLLGLYPARAAMTLAAGGMGGVACGFAAYLLLGALWLGTDAGAGLTALRIGAVYGCGAVVLLLAKAALPGAVAGWVVFGSVVWLPLLVTVVLHALIDLDLEDAAGAAIVVTAAMAAGTAGVAWLLG